MFHNCGGQSHKTVSTDLNFWRDRRAEADSNRGLSAYQPNALPLGQTGSHGQTSKLTSVKATVRDSLTKPPWFARLLTKPLAEHLPYPPHVTEGERDWSVGVARPVALPGPEEGRTQRSAKCRLKTVCCCVLPCPMSSVSVLCTVRSTTWPKISLLAARIKPEQMVITVKSLSQDDNTLSSLSSSSSSSQYLPSSMRLWYM